MRLPNLPLSRNQIRSFAEADRRINLWTGAIRSGKTVISLLRWLQYVANEAPRGGRLFIIGQTLQTIERNVIEPLQDAELLGTGIASQTVHTPGTTKAVIFGRTVHLIGAKDTKAFGRIRGATGAGAYVDEASLLPKGFLRELLGRLSLPGAKLFGTTNPDSPAHWLKVEYLDQMHKLDMAHWKFTLDDNPSLDPAFVRQTKAEHSGLWYKRLILGEWVAAEGTVYESYDPARHVVDHLPEQVTEWLGLGVDYGTTNPTAALAAAVAVDPADDVLRMWLTGEYRWDPRVEKHRLSDVQQSRNLLDWCAAAPRLDGSGETGWVPPYTVVDPSAASFIEQLHDDGLAGVTPADNAVLDGIRTVDSLISQDRLRIHSSCRGLVDELPGYSWDDDATEKGEDKPLKQADHSPDGVRYVIRTTEALWRPHFEAAA